MIEKQENEGIVTLRMAHGKASALDVELAAAMADALDEVAASDAAAVILTGSGTIFSAGVDLPRLIKDGANYASRFLPQLDRVLRTLFMFPKPVVGAANGHAIAGGCLMLLACDYRIMAAGNGRIGVPELLVGVPFPPLALEIFRFGVPMPGRQSMMYTGETLIPDRAFSTGVIDDLVEADSMLVRADSMARRLAAVPREAFRLTKLQLRQPFLEAADNRQKLVGAEVAATWSSPATHDHIRKYIEKTFGKR
jgi:enoyl-CoA hydratase